MLSDRDTDSLERLYIAFGMAAQIAQLVEKEMAALLLIPTLLEAKRPLEEADFEKATALLDKQPLGNLIIKFKKIASFGEGGEARLDEANRKRKYLIHHFFASYNERICFPDVREQMISELNEIRDFLHPIYKRLSEITAESYKEIGLTDTKIQEITEAWEHNFEKERKNIADKPHGFPIFEH